MVRRAPEHDEVQSKDFLRAAHAVTTSGNAGLNPALPLWFTAKQRGAAEFLQGVIGSATANQLCLGGRDDRPLCAGETVGCVMRFLPRHVYDSEPSRVLVPPNIQFDVLGVAVVNGRVVVGSKYTVSGDGLLRHFDGSRCASFMEGACGIVLNVHNGDASAAACSRIQVPLSPTMALLSVASAHGDEVEDLAHLKKCRVLTKLKSGRICDGVSMSSYPRASDAPECYRNSDIAASSSRTNLVAIAARSDQSGISVHNAADGKVISYFGNAADLAAAARLSSSSQDVASITFSYCGKFVLAAYMESMLVHVFDAKTGAYARAIDVSAAKDVRRNREARPFYVRDSLACTRDEVAVFDKLTRQIFLFDFCTGFYVATLRVGFIALTRASIGIRSAVGPTGNGEFAVGENRDGIVAIAASSSSVYGVSGTGTVYVWSAAQMRR
jgi:hypothetical protein